MEICEIDVSFTFRKVLKSQLFTDFIAEITAGVPERAHTWVAFPDESSNNRKSGTNLILENKVGLITEVSICFEFLTTKSHVEYEAFIASLSLADKMGEEKISCVHTHN